MTPHAQPPARQQLLGDLTRRLDALRSAHNYRSLQPLPSAGKHVDRHGQTLLNLAGNDYLALAQHPHLKHAAHRATELLGTGSTASRLVTGTLDLHAQLEQRFAQFKHADAALLLATGFTANLALLTTLATPSDLILQDKLNHASLLDAARFSNAQVRTYPHRDHARLEQLLKRTHDGTARRNARTYIVTDSVFSMDGDTADLGTLCDLADRYDAHVIIDEAHGTGVLGPTGAGLAELQGVTHRVLATVSTASKALGGLGGIITAPQPLIDTLINHARSFIYTTAPPPAQTAAIDAALDLVRDEPHRRQRLHDLSHELRQRLHQRGWDLGPSAPEAHHIATPIIPLIVGTSDAALALSQRLQHAGIAAAAIRYPTVPPNAARVRLSLRADLQDRDLDTLTDALAHP